MKYIITAIIASGLSISIFCNGAQAGEYKKGGKTYIDNSKTINNKAYSQSHSKAYGGKAYGGDAKAYGGQGGMGGQGGQGGAGGSSKSTAFNHLDIEGDHYPEFVSSAAPVVGTDCTYGSSLQDGGYGGAATFPSPVCNLFTAAHYHYEQEQYYLSLARVMADKSIGMKEDFDRSLTKTARVRPEAKQEIIKVAMMSESYYDQALYHMEEKNRLQESGVAKLKRLAVTGEIGGHITGLIPILGAVKVSD